MQFRAEPLIILSSQTCAWICELKYVIFSKGGKNHFSVIKTWDSVCRKDSWKFN